MVAEKNLVEVALNLPVPGVTPGPGIYRGVPSEQYHQWQLASSHRLSLLARSPAHMRHAIDNPPEQSPAMAIGEAAHLSVLETERFVGRYAVAPECDKRTTVGKATWQDFIERNPGKTPIKAADYEMIDGIGRAVLRHPAAFALLDGFPDVELSAVWKCRATGVGSKMRADGVRQDLGVVFDLKTCEDASRPAFERSIFNFGYARQAAHYLRGLNANGIGVDGFVFIAVEKTPPYAVCTYRLDDEVIAAADEELVRLLELYARCEQEQRWPAYSDDVISIGVPRWAAREMGIER